MADLYKTSGGNKAYAIAGLGTAAGTALSVLGASEFARGNSNKGFAYNVGAFGAGAAGVGGAYLYEARQQAQRKRQAETGYTGSDPFKDLDIGKGATAAELRRAYIKKAQAAHPDQGGSAAEMARVNSAYQEALLRTGQKRGTNSNKPKRAPSPRGRGTTTPSSSPGGRLLGPARGDSVWATGFAPTATRRDSPEAGTTDPQAAAEFFKTLLDAVTAAHLLHLRSRSFSQHSALGSFYSELEELTDGLIEAYLGKYGILDNYPEGPSLPTGQPIPFVTALSNYVRNTRGSVSSDSELQNEIDTIQKLIDSTLYKLTNLQ